jgi:hypothetical protein
MFVIHFLSVSFSPTTMQTSCYESIDVEKKNVRETVITLLNRSLDE